MSRKLSRVHRESFSIKFYEEGKIMKYLILVPDGAGDEKIEALSGKTPLEAAKLPFIDSLAAKGEVGMVKTIPDGVAPGSDAANLSVMG